LVRCSGLCGLDAVLDALRITRSDLFDDPPAFPSQRATRRIASPTSIPLGDEPKPDPVIPPLRQPNLEELATVAKLRGVTVEATALMAAHGLLYAVEHYGAECWVVGDARGRTWRIRRMDGEKWFGKVKSITFKHAPSDWPIGLEPDYGWRSQPGHMPPPAWRSAELVEGEGDLVAAYQLWIWAEDQGEPWGLPCAMAGARNGIHPEALAKLAAMPAGVRIWPDSDEEGKNGAVAWRDAIIGAGGKATVAAIPDGLKDLGEVAKAWNGGGL